MKTLTLALLTAGLAAAQTYTMEFNGDTGQCWNPNGCNNYTAVAQQPEPTYYPSTHATFTTGLNIPISFHTGTTHPQIQTPQLATGFGTFQWFSGGGQSGTVTIAALDCRFDNYGSFPFYSVACNGQDASGNSVSFTHIVYLALGRYGYWSWFDHWGPIVLTLATD